MPYLQSSVQDLKSMQIIHFMQSIHVSKSTFLPAGHLQGLCSQCCTSGQKELEGNSTTDKTGRKFGDRHAHGQQKSCLRKRGKNKGEPDCIQQSQCLHWLNPFYLTFINTGSLYDIKHIQLSLKSCDLWNRAVPKRVTTLGAYFGRCTDSNC